MSRVAILARLESQRCLHEDDITWLEEHSNVGTLECHAVYRVSSSDGWSFDGEPEQVLKNASVPDVVITDAGHHVLAVNDVTPGLFVEVARTDPERFWRQGLVGMGGLGLHVDSRDGAGFAPVEVDLGLERLTEVVDPDLGMPGELRLTWFGVHVEDMHPTRKDPWCSAAPHKYWRATGGEPADLHGSSLAVSSSAGAQGGADPTVVDVDGGEILLVPLLDAEGMASGIVGWSSPDGETWSLDGTPDVQTGVVGTTPDVARGPDGAWRLIYLAADFAIVTSDDGRTWDEGAVWLTHRDMAANPSLAVDPDGVWWLYFNMPDAECMEDVGESSPQDPGCG